MNLSSISTEHFWATASHGVGMGHESADERRPHEKFTYEHTTRRVHERVCSGLR